MPNEKTLVLCYPAGESDIEKIRAKFSSYDLIVSSQEKIAQDIFKADVFCGHAKNEPIDWKAVASHGRLKWIQSSAAGLDHCLSPEVINSEIIVSGCSGLFANQVAEHTLAVLFSLTRRLHEFQRAKEVKRFVRRPTDELAGKVVGIIGFGGNGRRIAEQLRGLVPKILVTDKFPDYRIPDYVRPYADFEMNSVFEKSNIVIVTLPLTLETRNLIGKEQFSLMDSGGYFINVARGAVVNQKELEHALVNGQIGFAGLDVVDPEPLPESSPLWGMENVTITPHVGAQSRTRIPLTTELLCMNLCRFENGEKMINEVDKKLEFPHPANRLGLDANGRIVLPEMV